LCGLAGGGKLGDDWEDLWRGGWGFEGKGREEGGCLSGYMCTGFGCVLFFFFCGEKLMVGWNVLDERFGIGF